MRLLCIIAVACVVQLRAAGLEVRVAENVTVYEDARFYSAFPSIVRRPDGELIVAFRRAPERRPFGGAVSHTDANSHLVQVRSKDGGKTWTREPELIYAHPFGGSQDPCMVQLRDGTIVCSSYAWAPLADTSKLKKPVASSGGFVFLGGYLMRSQNGGGSWEGPLIPPPCEGEANLDLFGQLIPAYNRGAMCEGRDGRLYWVVASARTNAPAHTANHLLVSDDKAQKWRYASVVAEDKKIAFNEASILQTPKGDLVAFLRSEGFEDRACIARSTDGGATFQWKDAGFKGHPHHLLQLPDQRVLVVYGYRHPPFGIRARVLNAECTNAAEAPELIIRADGGNGDLGYPWAAMVSSNRALVVYYFNRGDGLRQIVGTFLDIGAPAP